MLILTKVPSGARGLLAAVLESKRMAKAIR
jgi:hypothetical protein